MPDPKKIKVGDYIKYVNRPVECSSESYKVDKWDVDFLDKLIMRGRWQRIAFIDEYRNPWIYVKLNIDGKIEHHTWSIFENSGWIKKNLPNKRMHRTS